MKKFHNKGFTLAELLIVVAIIAVLVAFSIPVFFAQIEKSREAVDLSNLRSAYGAGVYKLNENSSGNSLETYIYNPSSGKLLTPSEAGKSGDTLYCGKGTSRTGNEKNIKSINWKDKDVSEYSISNKRILVESSGGMMYNPAKDYTDKYVITVTIYPPNQCVTAYFSLW